MRKRGGRHERGVLNAHAVVNFVALLETAKNGNRVFDGGLTDHHRLESPRECRIPLDILSIFVEGRRADAAQITTRQRRLQHVRSIRRALGIPCTHDRVQLVDEQNHLPVGLGNLTQNRFQAIFEFTAVFRPSHQRADIERNDAAILERLGYVARDHALRETLGNRGLAHARLTDQDRIVLAASRKDLHDPTDFLVAADHRV